jgi:hypothetical protein
MLSSILESITYLDDNQVIWIGHEILKIQYHTIRLLINYHKINNWLVGYKYPVDNRGQNSITWEHCISHYTSIPPNTLQKISEAFVIL